METAVAILGVLAVVAGWIAIAVALVKKCKRYPYSD